MPGNDSITIVSVKVAFFPTILPMFLFFVFGRYLDLVEKNFKTAFLKHIPENYSSMEDKEMGTHKFCSNYYVFPFPKKKKIYNCESKVLSSDSVCCFSVVEPNLDEYVFCRALSNVGNLSVGDK